MKRLLLTSLTAILGIGSLANVAGAHPDQYRNYPDSYEQEEAPKPAEPLRYRTQLPAEPEETYKDDDRRYQRTERFDRDNYRRERRRQMRIRRYYNNGTRNDPGRY
jgi:hypothetical protein